MQCVVDIMRIVGVRVLKVYVEVTRGGSLNRDHVCAYLFSKLSEKYHDDGLGSYFNGSGVKAHTFRMPYRKSFDVGEIFMIELRGIEVIEKKFGNVISEGDSVRFGRLEGNIVSVSEVAYVKKDSYTVYSPVLMRFGCKDMYDELGLTDDRLNVSDPCLVPSMGEDVWRDSIVRGLVRRAEVIYGDDVVSDFGNFEIVVKESRDVVVDVNMKGTRLSYLSMLGTVEIIGDDFWHDFAQRVGLGNRNTYGLGVIG